jgi:hypothetical protein
MAEMQVVQKSCHSVTRDSCPSGLRPSLAAVQNSYPAVLSNSREFSLPKCAIQKTPAFWARAFELGVAPSMVRSPERLTRGILAPRGCAPACGRPKWLSLPFCRTRGSSRSPNAPYKKPPPSGRGFCVWRSRRDSNSRPSGSKPLFFQFSSSCIVTNSLYTLAVGRYSPGHFLLGK